MTIVRQRLPLVLFSIGFLFILFHLNVQPAYAATFDVDTTSDANLTACTAAANDCSLRGAINAANSASGADTITFSVTGTINLTAALPAIASDITLTGPGISSLMVRRDTGGSYRIFQINSGVISISGMTISNGSVTSGGGGGILQTSGTLVLNNAVVSGNTSNGGAVSSGGQVEVNTSAIVNNTADSGITFTTGTSHTINNSTIGGNSGDGVTTTGSSGATLTNVTVSNNGGSALRQGGSAIILFNTILANSGGSDCTVTAGGVAAVNSLIESGLACLSTNFNNVSGDPLLGTLTGTYYPLNFGSPAINQGDSNLAVGSTDQIGNPRVAGGQTDMGAIEVIEPIVQLAPASASIAEGSSSNITLSRSGSTASAITVSLNITLGTGTTTDDFNLTGGSITGESGSVTATIPAGSASVTLTFAALNDSVGAEAQNSITITIVDTADYTSNANFSVTRTILANDFSVTNVNDSGDGSLRQAITNANAISGSQTITFSVTGTINLASALPVIASDIAISGPGLSALTVRRDTGGNYRIIEQSSGAVSISGITISNGSVTSGGGGGILQTSGSLVLNNVAVSGNTSNGGAVSSGGQVEVNYSAIVNNAAGSGITFTAGSSHAINNSTIGGNSGDGVATSATGGVTLTNTTISNNGGTALRQGGSAMILFNMLLANSGSGSDCTVTAGGVAAINSLIESGLSCLSTNFNNLSGDPALGTFTGTYYPLTSGSSVINRGDSNLATGSTDQIGNPRVANGQVDMGAIEFIDNMVRLTPVNLIIAEGTSQTLTLERTGSTTFAVAVGLNIALGTDMTTNDFNLTGGSITGESGNVTATIPAGAASVTLTFAALIDSVGAEADNIATITVIDRADYDLGTPITSVVTIPANDFLVTNVNDSGEGSLRQAILNANAISGVETITFSSLFSTSQTITLSSPLAIDTPMTIAAPGASMVNLSASGLNAFEIDTAEVITGLLLRGLTVTGGRIVIDSGRVTLGSSPIIITGNTTGCALLVNGGEVTLQAGSQIHNNSSPGDGGGVCVSGGSLLVTGNTTQINDNTAAGNGGGIFQNGGAVTVESGASVSGNDATTNGGGIYNSGGALTISDGRILNNSAASGDGVYSASGGSIGSGTCIVGNGDTAVVNTTGTLSATDNWWGTIWGPNIPAAPANTGSRVSSGDSIGGSGEASSSVNVGITTVPDDYGTYSTPPEGNWRLEAPAGCAVCTAVSGSSSPRVCVVPRP